MLVANLNAQFTLKSVTPSSAMPGENVTLRILGNTVQFSFSNCNCNSTPKCLMLKKGSFAMEGWPIVSFTYSNNTSPMINSFAQIWIEVDKSNYFDISFKIPDGQKQGMYDLTVWNGATGAVCQLQLKNAFHVGSQSETIDFPLSEFKLSPNPTSDILWISMPNDSPTLIQFFNQTNEIVGEQLISQKNQSIDIGHLNKGLYAVKLYRHGKVVLTQKLVLI
jgi:hypothetical protein